MVGKSERNMLLNISNMKKRKHTASAALIVAIIFAYFALIPNVFAASQPSVATLSVGNLTPNSATVNGSVDPHGAFTAAWFEYGPTTSQEQRTGQITFFPHDTPELITMILSGLQSNTRYYYRIGASNGYGTAYGATQEFITPSGSRTSGQSTTVSSPATIIYSPALRSAGTPFVTTQGASLVTTNSALLNGTVNPNGGLANAWFEWGDTAALGNTSVVQNKGDGTNDLPYAFLLQNLKPGTTYHYRASANNNLGMTKGAILTFKTGFSAVQPVVPAPAVPRAIPRPIEQGNERARVVLTPSADKSVARPGDDLVYSISIRNEHDGRITDAMLKTTLPAGVEFVSANARQIAQTGNALSFAMGGFSAGSEEKINIHVRVKDTDETQYALVFDSAIDYKDPSGHAQSATSFLTIPVERPAGLAALIGGGGIPFWLFALIFIMIIGYFFHRRYEIRKRTPIKI